MWSFSKLFGGLARSRRQARRTLLGDLEVFERRRLLSVAMPPAEIRAIVPPDGLGESAVGVPASSGGAAAARAASANADVGTNAGLVPASVDAADQSANSGQDDGDIPPVLGKVAW